MTPRRVLLVESLDAPGTAAADVALHSRVLEEAGFTVCAGLIERRVDSRHPRVKAGSSRRFERLLRFREGDELMSTIDRTGPDLVVVASASRGGGAMVESLPNGLPARWWPTAIHPRRPGRRALSGPRGWLEALTGPTAEDRGEASLETAGLDWAVHDEPEIGGGHLTLWDGDYVLVPTPLAGHAGSTALHGFASVARHWNALDLVVLANPQPAYERMARELGVGTRVHFAGEAPREAESVWVGDAFGLVLGNEGPLAAGLILRALARGCPIVTCGRFGTGALVRAWLKQRGIARPAKAGNDPFPTELERVLERGPELEAEIARGRAVALEHQVSTIAPRLTRALTPKDPGRRAA